VAPATTPTATGPARALRAPRPSAAAPAAAARARGAGRPTRGGAGGRYDGEWRDDRAHGEGRYEYRAGDAYAGAWVKGKKSGRGEFSFAGGDVYRGTVSPTARRAPPGRRAQGRRGAGLRRGRGHAPAGEFAEDDINGAGEKTFANGDVYVGGWRRGLRHGQGRITYAPRAGSADFEGEWVDDVPQLPARDAAAEEAAALAALEAREAAERERAAREEEAEAARRAEDAEAAASWERERAREEQERQQAREAQEGAAARAAEAEAAKAADEAAAAAAAEAAKAEAAAAAAAGGSKKQDEDGHLSGSDTARHPAAPAPAPAPAPPLEPAPPSAPRPITHAATVRGGGGNGSKAGRSGVPQLGLEVLDAGDGARGASDARRGGAGDGGGRESLAGRRPLSARGVNILPETSQLFPLPADAPEAVCAPGASRPGSARRAGRGD
jgi:hypothetical protein